MNTKFTFLLALLTSLLLSASALAEPVNAVIGDDSWYALKRGTPVNAGEVERIQTHLAWVGVVLSNADTSHLSSEVAKRRAAMLQELERYRAEGQFPQHEIAGEGRQPRWVDHEGRACAVGHLVAASGHQELFDRVAADHEYDYVPDIDAPKLLAWANHYGFSVRELAMIQPAYRHGGSVDMPDPWEEKRRQEEEERRRKIPRPLTVEHVESLVSGNISDRDLKRACLKLEHGDWAIETRIRVGKSVKARIKVVVTKGGEAVPAATNRCFERELAKRVQESLDFVNYTVDDPIKVSQEFAIEIPDGTQIEGEFLKRDAYVRHFGSPSAALAKCFDKFEVSGDSAVIPLSVSSWNGQVVLRWREIRRAEDIEYRRFGWCLQDVLNYGSVKTYGIWDHLFTIRIDSNGEMEVLPKER